MVGYLLLSIVFGLVILIAIGTLIFGFIKKKRNFLITAVTLLVVGTIGCVYSVSTYTKKAIDYVQSKEFQDDAKKGAELLGQTAGSITAGVSDGLSNTLDDEAIEKLASKSAVIIGKSVKTIAAGFDSTLGNKNIYPDNSLENSGLELGNAVEEYKSKTNDLAIFIDYQKDFKGKLRITNYDQAGKKIDVAEKDINVKMGQGRVEVFSFSHSNLGLTTYYIISRVDKG